MTTTIREPSITANLLSANTVIENAEQKILILGQLSLSGSTAVAGTLYTSIESATQAEALFGARSNIAQQFRSIRLENDYTRIDVLPQLNLPPAGVIATGGLGLTGTATTDGVLTAVIGSARTQTYTVAITNGATSASLLTALKALIDADTKQPVIAGTIAAGAIPLTTDFGGTWANTIALKLACTASGIVLAVTPFSAGGGAFTLVLDSIDQIRYQTILCPFETSLTAVGTYLSARFNVTNNVLDGVCINTRSDSFASNSSALSALNSNSLVIYPDRKVTPTTTRSGSSVLEYPWNFSAQFGAIRAGRRTKGANISAWVIATNGSLDRTGGIAISSLPYFNTPMAYIPVMEQGNAYGWTSAEETILKDAGGASFGNNISNTQVLIGEVVTTYKTDPASNPDITWKYLEYVDTSSSIREYYFNNLKADYRQHRLTTGAILAGRAMANAQTISASCTKYYQALANDALAQFGDAFLAFYKKNLTVTIDVPNGKASVSMLMPIVTQLREIIANIQIDFTSEG